MTVKTVAAPYKPGQVRSEDFRLTKGGGMARNRFTAEEIIGHLRTIEIDTGKGLGIAEACRKLGITAQNSGMSC